MAWTITLAQLRTAVRNRGGYRRSMSLIDSILDEFINFGVSKLHEFIVKHNPDFILKKTSPDLTTTPGSDSVPLPGDFYRLRGRPLLLTSGRILKIHEFDLDEEGDFEDLAVFGYDGASYRYMLQAGNLRLVPAPTVVDTIRLWYLPHATKLVNAADVYDGQNGHEDLIIEWALHQAAERDRRPYDMNRIAAAESRIISSISPRDQSGPDYLVDHGRGWPLWGG